MSDGQMSEPLRIANTNMDIHDIASTTNSLRPSDPKTLRALSDVCFTAGFASILGSILVWGLKKGTDEDAKAERFGIFVGLWAPTFFILSNRFERYAERAETP
jgi:hypothetical protein